MINDTFSSIPPPQRQRIITTSKNDKSSSEQQNHKKLAQIITNRSQKLSEKHHKKLNKSFHKIYANITKKIPILQKCASNTTKRNFQIS